jgi:siroheme synthase (precorrin-2 oxidase/ferrochelatase)
VIRISNIFYFIVKQVMKFYSFHLVLFLLLPRGMRAFLHASRSQRRRPSSAIHYDTDADDSEIGFHLLKNKNVLVVGGSGRVGGSVVTQLLTHGAHVTVGGTRIKAYDDSKRRWADIFPLLDTTTLRFEMIDREVAKSVLDVLKSMEYDLVVHTAGPFQGKVAIPNGVIDAAVQCQVPYVDVCDDYCTASAAKTKYAKLAQELGVPCIVSTGCWVSLRLFLRGMPASPFTDIVASRSLVCRV